MNEHDKTVVRKEAVIAELEHYYSKLASCTSMEQIDMELAEMLGYIKGLKWRPE